MPVQHTLFGRPVPRIPPRRLPILLGTIALLAVTILVFALPNAIPSGPSLSKFADAHSIPIPKLPTKLPYASSLNPFRPAAHPPPVQKNSTSGDTSWYSNWNWLRPFSSSFTLDENRSLLPPLLDRPAIYTYYDHTVKKDPELKDAENDLLLTWRRAWWAKGFKPIILGPAEARNNPHWEELQLMDLDANLQTDMARWLAWETMGTGLLCNYLTLPMASYDDDLLNFLRRAEYPKLTRFEGLGNGLFVGEKKDITEAVKQAMSNKELATQKDFISAVPLSTFDVDPNHQGVAFYDAHTITTKYSKLTEDLLGDEVSLFKALNKLINGHLHMTWQNVFTEGIAVLKPIRQHMTVALEPAIELANYLVQCADTPIPSSCPPNRPKCKPCVAAHPLKVFEPPQFRNESNIFTIGTVFHPWTLATLSFGESIDVPFIRRNTTRDTWIMTATKSLMGTGVSSSPRIVRFKEAVASPYGAARSLWLAAEKGTPKDLDWYFGFTIPKIGMDSGKSETPVPGPERRPQPPKPDPKDGPVPTERDLERESELLTKAKAFIKKSDKTTKRILNAIEAWNLADVEAWRFARAYLARSRVERKKWAEEEKHYAGGVGSEEEPRQGWYGWFDSDDA